MPCNVTHEDLAAYAVGETDPARAAAMDRHLPTCAACRAGLGAIRGADATLAALPPYRPSVAAELEARRALSAEIRGAQALPEVMTLDEVGAFLRVAPAELEELASDLPAFEITGRVRVRKARLIEWIEGRERDYGRDVTLSGVARMFKLTPRQGAA